MEKLKPWQEVIGRIDSIEPISDGYRIVVDGYTVEIPAEIDANEGDKVSVLRTADSHIISNND
jgi:hypothetical protein